MAEPGSFAQLDDPRLGETPGEFRLHDHAEARAAALALFRQARRCLRLFSHDLDARLIADDDFARAASELARRNRSTFIRLLIQNARPAMRFHHPLVPLIQALPSHIGARRVPKEWSQEPFGFLIADNRGLLYRPDAGRFDGSIEFNAPARAVQYRDWFDELWEQSTPEREFRRLRL